MKPGHLPPFTALRAFEACARHRSFARAATELGVTPGAITQHIRAIEEWAGVPLFKRTGREVLLTELAESAMPSLREAFASMSQAGRILRSSHRKTNVISVSAAPSFASKWLLPRLARFNALYPGTEVWVAADMNLVDFHKSEIDLAIRYGGGAYDGLMAEKMLAETVVPVASPAFVEQFGAFERPEDLLRASLLHDVDREGDPSCPDWAMWFQARGVAIPPVISGPRYNQTSLVIEEAVAGKGLALAKSAIAAADIESGRLVALLDDQTPLAYAYWIVWPRGRSLSKAVRAFIAWLMAQSYSDNISSPEEPELSGA